MHPRNSPLRSRSATALWKYHTVTRYQRSAFVRTLPQPAPRHCARPLADAYVCSADWTATVNCIGLSHGVFPLSYAMECVFVALSIAFLCHHHIISAVGIVLSYAAAYTYLFTQRTPPSEVTTLPVAARATDDAIRVCIALGALLLLCLAVSVFTQRLTRSGFTAAWSLNAQFLEQRAALQRERTLRSELQASRDAAIISHTARGIQELVAGFLSHRLRNPGDLHRPSAVPRAVVDEPTSQRKLHETNGAH